MPLSPKTSDQELYDPCREIYERDGNGDGQLPAQRGGGGGYNRLKAIVEAWNQLSIPSILDERNSPVTLSALFGRLTSGMCTPVVWNKNPDSTNLFPTYRESGAAWTAGRK